jgi:DNA polymerase-3 subunit beta
VGSALARAAGTAPGGPAGSAGPAVVRLTAESQAVRVGATDGEIALECRVPAEVAEVGEVALPARPLLEILGALPEWPVAIESREPEQARIACGPSEYHLPVFSLGELPPLPAVGAGESSGAASRFAVPAGVLRRMIRPALPAAATDDARPLLSGVLPTWWGVST